MKGFRDLHDVRLMGRLGYLAANPHRARPGELDRLADHLLACGQQRRGRTEWQTLRQERRLARREVLLGDQVARVSMFPHPGSQHWHVLG